MKLLFDKEAANYLDDNYGLCNDVLIALRELRDTSKPPGRERKMQRDGKTIFYAETEHHWFYYARYSNTLVVTVIRPK